MALKPVDGHPGLWKDTETNQIYNYRDFHSFESSDLLEGMLFEFETSGIDTMVLDAWRFTCVRWPSAEEVQQQVELVVGFRLVALVSLSSVLTLAEVRPEQNVPTPLGVVRVGLDRHLQEERITAPPLIHRNTFVTVKLRERPVAGAGLRVHLRGQRRNPIV